MTRVAAISDIHSNLEALEATMRELRGYEIVCLGDIVGYGANPNEVIEVLRGAKVLAIQGNHDNAVLTGDVSMFNARAAVAAKWTSAKLTPSSREYLESLPTERGVVLDGVKTYLAHGSPDDNLWEYVDPSTHHALFDHYLAKLGVGLIGLGHTHVPYVWPGERGTVFNPGSVGQPRDGDPRSSHAIVAVENGEVKVEVRRLDYDISAAAAKIVDAGLPESLGARLLRGM
jgi:putative phosphoesterase